MPSFEQLQCFVTAVEEGSFSAAARKLGKAQSAVSTSIANLEIDVDVELFDRSKRNPELTEEGQALLKTAETVLQSHQEFISHASSLGEGDNTQLCIAIDQSISLSLILPLLDRFSSQFPHVTLELLDPGSGDVAELLRSGRAEIGLMIAQEHYPTGFCFRGIGHSKVVPVCHSEHPLAHMGEVGNADLRQYRQLLERSLNPENKTHERYGISPKRWLAESPHMILEMVMSGLGWAFLHETVVQEKLNSGELIRLNLSYLQTDILQYVDLVWTENQPLGKAGHWFIEQFNTL